MSSIQPAQRVNRMGFSEIVKIRDRILELRKEGVEIFEFHGGEPYPTVPQPVKDAFVRALVEDRTTYAPSSGVHELLEAITGKVRERNRIPVEAGQAIVVNGGVHGLFASFLSVMNPGDEVLVLSPYWKPISDFIVLAEGRIVTVDSFEARRQGLAKAFESHLTERTRVIYFNSPTNPTGQAFSREEIEAVADFAVSRNLVVVSDEAYEDIIYDREHLSIASLPGMLERTLTVFTLSKTFAMTGCRIGYVIAGEPWMTGLRKLVLNSTNGVSTPTQWAAIEALTLDGEYLEEVCRGYRERRDLLVDGLRAAGFRCDMPEGAFYAFPRFDPALGKDSWEACNRLLDEYHISTVPGVVFGPEGEGHLRFSFSTSLQTIERAMTHLSPAR